MTDAPAAYADVVRSRRMVRNFRTDPVASEVVDHLIDLARRAPSAGNTWGTHFVLLNDDDVARYWDLTLPEERRDTFPWPGLLEAPLIVLPCGDARAYVDRYGEPDKAHTGLGSGADAWSIPYWHVDTAMATMILLNAATAAGLGALFFGIFDNEPAVRAAFAIPDGVRPIGAVALGHPASSQRKSKSVARGLAPLDDIVHRGGW